MQKEKSWKFISTEEKYKNPWISVREDKVIRPDGKPGIFGVVTMVPGISVLPLDDDGFVYLTKEFHYALGKDGVEVVSGAIDNGETGLAAAKRELKEELGIEAVGWTELGLVNPFTTVVYSPANLYLAQGLTFSSSHQEGTETINLIKIKLEEAVRMVMDSEITHGPSCVLILKAAKHLNR